MVMNVRRSGSEEEGTEREREKEGDRGEKGETE